MNGSFMIGCGGDFTPEYPVGNSLSLFNQNGTFIRTFPEAWRDRPIKAFGVHASVRFHSDNNEWINNRVVENVTTRDDMKTPWMELAIARAVQSVYKDNNGGYDFDNVQNNSTFYLLGYTVRKHSNRVILETLGSNDINGRPLNRPDTHNLFRATFSWDTSNYTVTVNVSNSEIFNIGWLPIFY